MNDCHVEEPRLVGRWGVDGWISTDFLGSEKDVIRNSDNESSGVVQDGLDAEGTTRHAMAGLDHEIMN